jgi:acyl carrier protein
MVLAERRSRLVLTTISEGGLKKDQIRQFIFEKFPLAKSRKLEDSSALLEEGVLDSLGILELVDYLQSELGVNVDDDDLVPENFASVDAIAAFVDSKTETTA